MKRINEKTGSPFGKGGRRGVLYEAKGGSLYRGKAGPLQKTVTHGCGVHGVTALVVLGVFILMAIPAHAGTKVDPFLRGLCDAVNGVSPYRPLSTLSPMSSGGPVSRPLSGNSMVDVLIKTTSPSDMRHMITENGGTVGTSIDGIVTAAVPLFLIGDLVQRQDCVDIALSRKLNLLLDKSVPAVFGDVVHQGGAGLPRPYTGRDVIVGIVDSGLDLTHADLHYPDGSTKVISLWDQTISGTPPNAYTYGDECTSYQINTAQCKEQDTVGHGTHVTGIIASNDSVYTGMAPDVMLVIVKTDMTEAHVLDGINYVFSIASRYNLPAVINLSLGAQIGPHDDSTSMEQAIDGFVMQTTTPRAIVAAAGNDGGNPVHLGFTANAGTSYASYFSVVSNSASPGESDIDLWYYTPAPALSFALGVVGLNGHLLSWTGWVPTGSTLPATPLYYNGTTYGYASIDASAVAWGGTDSNEVVLSVTNNGDPAIDLTRFMYGSRYVLLVKNNNGLNTQALNAWLSTDNSLFDTMTTVAQPITTGSTMVPGDTIDTVDFPATARYAIAVASFVTKISWTTCNGICNGGLYTAYFPDTQPVGDLSFFSSKGPTPLPSATGRKPNIAAPGEMVVAALSTQALFDQSWITSDGTHVALRGTSMASPHVAGAVALLYDRDNALDITDTIGLLESSATFDTWTTSVPNDDWGGGKLDALALVQSATTTPSDTTSPVISHVSVSSVKTSSAEVMWATDKLSSSYIRYWNASSPAKVSSSGTTTMTVAHIVDLSGLSQNARYLYQVVSTDPMGNTAVYPQTGGIQFTTQRVSRSSGCTCEQSYGRTTAGDLFPYLLLLLAWCVVLRPLARMYGR